MRRDLSELVFILDRSGSMSGLEGDTIGGYNAMLEKQRREKGEAVVTTVLFDDHVDILHSREDIRDVRELTDKQYYARGCTALLDAVGDAIERTKKRQAELIDEARPAHTIFVITTDGEENSSRRYTFEKVRHLVEECQTEHGWEFLFLGADMDAIASAARLGIEGHNAASQCHDAMGTALGFASIDRALCARRMGAAPSADWKSDLEADYKARKQGGTPRKKSYHGR